MTEMKDCWVKRRKKRRTERRKGFLWFLLPPFSLSLLLRLQVVYFVSIGRKRERDNSLWSFISICPFSFDCSPTWNKISSLLWFLVIVALAWLSLCSILLAESVSFRRKHTRPPFSASSPEEDYIWVNNNNNWTAENFNCQSKSVFFDWTVFLSLMETDRLFSFSYKIHDKR